LICGDNMEHSFATAQGKLKRPRLSSIELLKIIAMLLIVTFHVTQTLSVQTSAFGEPYVIDFKHATTNPQYVILAWFMSFGTQGNMIFFLCSAWFLLESKRTDYSKIVRLLCDIWVVNVIFLIVFLVGGWYPLSMTDVVKSFFPTVFALNWYLTCYILFYSVHTWLNHIIQNCSQKQLLSFNLICLTLYFGINYVDSGHFFVNKLLVCTILYCVIAYVKYYMPKYHMSIKANLIGLLIGLLGTPILICVTNLLGLRIPLLAGQLQRWCGNNSPFTLLTAVSLFNLFSRARFVNRGVNYVSSLSLLIYIIHENHLFRNYVRPDIWIWLHDRIGYGSILVADLLFALALFLCAVIAATVYKATIQKLVAAASIKLYKLLNSVFRKLTDSLLKLH